jgi:hypothetical protein
MLNLLYAFKDIWNSHWSISNSKSAYRNPCLRYADETKKLNSKLETPAFAGAPALRKASGGGASRRQAKL